MRLFNAIFKKSHIPDEDGGIRKRICRNAPKSIDCENIISFECVFSTVALADDISIEHGVYTLSAKLKDGAARGEYKMRSRNGEGEQFIIHKSYRFMRQLQEIVKAYDFAKYNGNECFVSGLPDMYGAKIHIVYASGESIYASDNQDNFLPFEAMQALIELFKRK